MLGNYKGSNYEKNDSNNINRKKDIKNLEMDNYLL
jgi:hypothetical protein